MVFNILAINRDTYIKAAIININSYHKFDDTQLFKLYVDKQSYRYFDTVKHKLLCLDKVRIEIFDDITENFQHYKVKIFEDYYNKEDFVILDADSLWIAKPTISKDKITFLNQSHTFVDCPKQALPDANVLKELDSNIDINMSNYQIGFLCIPKQFHHDGIVDEWYKLMNDISGFSKLTEMYQRQCEQLAIGIIAQVKYPEAVSVLEDNPYRNRADVEYLESFYFGCRAEHDQILRQYGWVD